ncbi:MAG: FlgD immunoglobulin-like domain containing protein, partial [Gemmatimonadota bacterium]
GWDEEVLGAVSGTFANYGTVYPHEMTPDGSMVIGYNAFDWNQSTGFIWTEEAGMIDVEDYLSDSGITVPTSYNIRSLTGMSHDGTVMIGCGSDTYPPYNGSWFIIRSTATGIAEEPAAPEEAQFVSSVHAYPNPMRGGTALSFTLPRPQDVKLTVYDISGRLVAEVDDGYREAGLQEIAWDGRDANGAVVASGIYLCRLDAGEHHATRKVTVLR